MAHPHANCAHCLEGRGVVESKESEDAPAPARTAPAVATAVVPGEPRASPALSTASSADASFIPDDNSFILDCRTAMRPTVPVPEVAARLGMPAEILTLMRTIGALSDAAFVNATSAAGVQFRVDNGLKELMAAVERVETGARRTCIPSDLLREELAGGSAVGTFHVGAHLFALRSEIDAVKAKLVAAFGGAGGSGGSGTGAAGLPDAATGVVSRGTSVDTSGDAALAAALQAAEDPVVTGSGTLAPPAPHGYRAGTGTIARTGTAATTGGWRGVNERGRMTVMGPPLTVATCKALATLPEYAVPSEFCRALGLDDRTWNALHVRGIVETSFAGGRSTVMRDVALKSINRRTADLATAAEHCGVGPDELVAHMFEVESFVGVMDIGGQARVLVSEVDALR